MGEALISGAGGGTGKIYKWKRYEINSKTVYEWDKYSVLETTEYKWNKWNTKSGWQESCINYDYYFSSNQAPSIGNWITQSYTINQDTGLYEPVPPYLSAWGSNGGHYISRYSDQRRRRVLLGGWKEHENSQYTVYEHSQEWYLSSATIKGDTSYGQVTSSSSSAYPSNGISGSYWYVSAGSTTTTSKGSTSYGKVESESFSAYPNGGAQSGYWYENRNSRVDQSIGSYKDAVYSTARNTYPDNGIQGGYWYVFEEV